MHSMNKTLLITLCMLIFSTPCFAIQNTVEQEKSTNLTELSDFTGEKFFKSSVDLQKEREADIKNQKTNFYREFKPAYGGTYDFPNKKTMPPLKKIRVKIAKHNANKALKNSENASIDSNGVEEENIVEQEEREQTQAVMKCKTMKYLPQSKEMEAIGGVEITFPQQGAVLTSKRMTYNQATNVIQAFDDVKIVRDGQTVYGDYLKIDMNEESGLMNNVKVSEFEFDVYAENGYMFGDTLIATNGKAKSNSERIFSLASSGFGDDLRNMILPKEDMAFLLTDIEGSKMLVKVKELKIKAKKSHDTIQLKHAKIYTKNGKKIASVPTMTLYTNKEQDYFEGNYPEVGSYPEFGMYAGPGFVIEAPLGSTLKLAPIVTTQGKFGFGGLAKFRSGTNKTDLGYNTSANMFMLKGYQRLDDNLLIQYGAHSYMDEWFMGSSWLGYGGELLYEKGYGHSDFLYKNANLSFRHRASAGFFQENDKDKDNDSYGGYHEMGTLRLKYMAELRQTLFSLRSLDNKDDYETYVKNKNWKVCDLNLIAQAASALYGSGDTQFIGRVGPQLVSQYKFWRQEIGYFLSGYSDQSPLETMDLYRYGRSNVYLREYLRLSKFVTLGLYASYKLSNDDDYDYQASKQSKLREATFYVALGPDDFKVNLGWDAIRNSTYLGLSMAMNTKGSGIEYDRLEIKDGDRIGKTDDMINSLDEQTEFIAPASPYKSKATVTYIDDPSTVMSGETL